MTLGFVLVGGSAFVLLAAGPRLLGPAGFSGLGLVWTVSTVFGIGIAVPTEQVMIRGMNAGHSHALGGPLRALGALGVFAALACLVLGSRAPAAEGLSFLPWAMALSVLGWVFLAFVRGRLGGTGDLTAYGAVLVVESAGRLAMVALAVLVPGWAPVVLMLGVGLPLIVAALAGLGFRIPSALVDADRVDGGSGAGQARSDQPAFVLIAVGLQICLNGAPLLLEWRFGGLFPAVVGAFVAANTYFRTPTLLIGGVLTHALVALSHAWGEGDLAGFRTARRSALKTSLLVLIPTTLLLVAASPVVLRLYYGGPVDLPLVVLAALPVSTLVATMGQVETLPLMASGRGRVAGVLWIAGALVTSAILLSSQGVGWGIAAGLVLGPLVALVGAALANRRTLAARQGTERTGVHP